MPSVRSGYCMNIRSAAKWALKRGVITHAQFDSLDLEPARDKVSFSECVDPIPKEASASARKDDSPGIHWVTLPRKLKRAPQWISKLFEPPRLAAHPQTLDWLVFLPFKSKTVNAAPLGVKRAHFACETEEYRDIKRLLLEDADLADSDVEWVTIVTPEKYDNYDSYYCAYGRSDIAKHWVLKNIDGRLSVGISFSSDEVKVTGTFSDEHGKSTEMSSGQPFTLWNVVPIYRLPAYRALIVYLRVPLKANNPTEAAEISVKIDPDFDPKSSLDPAPFTFLFPPELADKKNEDDDHFMVKVELCARLTITGRVSLELQEVPPDDGITYSKLKDKIRVKAHAVNVFMGRGEDLEMKSWKEELF